MRFAVPVFVTVTVFDTPRPSPLEPNATELGSPRNGCGSMPVPDSCTVSGELCASLGTVTAPVRDPSCVGVKVTPKLHVWPFGTSWFEHVSFTSAKSPETASCPMFRSAPPVFWIVAVETALVVLIVWMPKANWFGGSVNDTAEWVPKPFRCADCGLFGASSVSTSAP